MIRLGKLIASLTLIVYASVSFGQQVDWVNNGGGSSFDVGMDITSDGAGNSYGTGTVLANAANFPRWGNDSIHPGSNRSYEAYIVKHDIRGNRKWLVSMGGTGIELGTGIEMDSDTSFIVCGLYASSNATFDTISGPAASTTTVRLYVARYDTAGNIQWFNHALLGQVPMSPFNLFYNPRISTNDSGVVMISGIFRGSATFGSTTVTASGGAFDFDNFIAKYSTASGTLRWVKKYGGSGFNFSGGVAVDNNGNAYVTGFFSGTTVVDTISITASGSRDIYVAQFNDTGRVQWAFAEGGTSVDDAYGIAIDKFNNLYVGGSFIGTFNFDTVSVSASSGGFQRDVFLARLTTDGRALWVRSGGGINNSNDFLYALDTDDRGNVGITGQFGGSAAIFGNDTIAGNGAWRSIYFSLIDSLGDFSWSVAGSGSSFAFNQGNGITLDSAKNLYATGQGDPPLVFDNIAWSTGAGLRDAFIIKISDCVDADTAIINAPTTTAGCLGDTFRLSSNNIASLDYQWMVNGMPLVFDTDSVYGAFQTGNYQVVVTDDGCIDTSESVAITVNALPNVTLSSFSTLCSGVGAVTLTQGSPFGGTYAGVGMVNDTVFNTDTSGVGTFGITYTYTDTSTGCTDSAFRQLQVVNATASLSAFSPVCDNEPAFTLSGGSPSGGTYYVNGSAASSFNPSTQGVGTYTIRYVISQSGCMDTATQNLTVNVGPTASFTALSPVCVSTSFVTLSGGSPGGGTYSGPGVAFGSFFPGFAGGAGTYTINYIVTNAGCSDTASQPITVDPTFSVVFNPSQTSYCSDGDNDTLNATPAGGLFTGTGIINDSVFSPTTAGVGTWPIKYKYTNACGSDSVTRNLVVVTGPTATLSAIPAICEGSDPYTLSEGSPAGGTYFGSGISGGQFDPSVTGDGTFTIFYAVTDTAGCSDTASRSITVHPQPNVTLSALTAVCVDASSFALSGGSPTGGTYSGAGVTGGNFNPATAGVGTWPITYTFTDANSCTDSATQNQVVNALPTVSFSIISNVCANASAFTLTQGSPTGGTYSGTGVTGGNTFNPAISGTGTFTLTYSFTDGNGCSDDATQTVTVDTLPTVTISSISALCEGSNAITLTQGSPTGGTYFGTGVSSGTFNPATAGAGTTTIGYTFTDGNGCTDTATTNVTVNAQPNVTLSALTAVCVDASSFALSGGSPTGGTYSGAGVTAGNFNPASAGVGTWPITYTFTDANSCTDSATQNQVVNALPTVSFSIISNVCANASAFTLTQGSPTGGTYSGTGVTGGNTFNPSISGTGTFTLTYSFTDGNGCSDDATQTVTVDTLPTVTLSSISALCEGSNAITLTQGSPTGGTYFGTGVSSGTFNPATAGAGTTTIGYTFTDGNGCTDTATTNVTVNAQPNVSYAVAIGNFCINSYDTVTLYQGAPGGGTYSGPGIFSDSLYILDSAGVGTHSITYTFTDGNGCTDSVSANSTIFAAPNATFSSISNLCANSSALTLTQGGPTGGTYSGTGVSSGVFDPSVSGVGTFTLSYSVTNSNSCSDSATQTVTVDTLPTVTISSINALCAGSDTISLNQGSPSGGTYFGTGVTGTSFDPSVPGAGTSNVNYGFTDGNGCSDTATTAVTIFAQPSVTLSAFSSLCANDDTLNLSGGSPTGGSYSGTGVSSGVFDPTTSGAGAFGITYLFTDGNSCTDSASQNIVVDTVPIVNFSALASICGNASTLTLSQGSPAGGTYSGTGVTAGVFDPTVSGTGTFNLKYEFTDANSCSDSAFQTIGVDTIPTVSFGALSNVCFGDTAFTLNTGSPAGGVYSGAGVVGSDFDPSIAGAGTITLQYKFTNTNGCADSTTQSIVVDSLPQVSFTSFGNVCANADAFQLTGGAPVGGVYSGLRVVNDTLNPSLLPGTGADSVKYIFTNVNGCTDSAQVNFIVDTVPLVTFANLNNECFNNPVITLNQGNPAGGNYSGTGVSAGTFDPSLATGLFSIKYEFTDANGCSDSAFNSITVDTLPIVNFPTLSNLCIGNGDFVLNSASPMGGVYSGDGVINDTIFNPDSSTVLAPVIKYTFTDANGCVDSSNQTLQIDTLPIVSFIYQDTSCQNVGLDTLRGGLPMGGIYVGSGIVNDSIFDAPSLLPDTYRISYVFTNSQGCTDSAAIETYVLENPSASLNLNITDICANDTAVLLSGGNPGNGRYFGSRIINGIFNPALANVARTQVFYEAGNYCGLDTASAFINVNSPAVMTAVKGEFCTDETQRILDLVSPSGGYYYGSSINQDSILTIEGRDTGNYTFSYVYNDGTCTDTLLGDYRINVIPNLGIGYDTTICSANPLEISIDSSLSSYRWNGVQGDSVLFVAAKELTVGLNIISIRANNGGICDGSDSVRIFVEPCSRLTVRPNPSNGRFFMDMNMLVDDEVKITIYNGIGQDIINLELPVYVGMNSLPFELADFGGGIYVIKIKGQFIDETEKIMIR